MLYGDLRARFSVRFWPCTACRANSYPAGPLGRILGSVSEVPIWEASSHLSEVAHEAVQRGEVVYLTEHGQRLAAIVPADLAARIEAAEDAEDLAAALAARDEAGPPVSAEQLWAELGL